MRKLQLDLSIEGLPGITKKRGGSWQEAALLALVLNKHASGVVLELSGDTEEQVQIIWEKQLDKDAQLSWNDLTKLVEEAATGIALLLIQEFTSYQVFWRAR